MPIFRPPAIPAFSDLPFPCPTKALDEPNGLLAVGADLSPKRLLMAYQNGIFPWFSEGQPILWWSPHPRAVFDTGRRILPSRFARSLRASRWRITADSAFSDVVRRCAQTPRAGQDGTWITQAMQQAYGELHRVGVAHSLEVWLDEELVGGIYGVAVGRLFCGESMFSALPGGSKVALAALCGFLSAQGAPLLDAQIENPHLMLLGARTMSRLEFIKQVYALRDQPALPPHWGSAFGMRWARDLA